MCTSWHANTDTGMQVLQETDTEGSSANTDTGMQVMQEADTEGSPGGPSHGDLGQLPLPGLHSQLGAACASSQHLSLLGGSYG